MIKEFFDRDTAALYQGLTPGKVPPDVVRRAHIKLLQIDAATTLDFLRVPPGNRLEALAGGRAGQHSIRVNDQWRICVVWTDGNAWRVEFCDYH